MHWYNEHELTEEKKHELLEYSDRKQFKSIIIGMFQELFMFNAHGILEGATIILYSSAKQTLYTFCLWQLIMIVYMLHLIANVAYVSPPCDIRYMYRHHAISGICIATMRYQVYVSPPCDIRYMYRHHAISGICIATMRYQVYVSPPCDIRYMYRHHAISGIRTSSKASMNIS